MAGDPGPVPVPVPVAGKRRKPPTPPPGLPTTDDRLAVDLTVPDLPQTGPAQTGSPLHQPASSLFVVICFVGGTLLLTTLGILLLAYAGKPIPDILGNTNVGSLAGLTGLLALNRATGTPVG